MFPPRLFTAVALAMLACAHPAPAQEAARSTTPAARPARMTEVAKDLVHPWALEFLPDGRMLVTERPGRLRIVSPGGKLSAPLAGVPAVHARGQGGLLDVALHPQFAANQLVYLSYAEPGPGGTAGTAVARGALQGEALVDVAVIYRQEPKKAGDGHFGSRLVFTRDGHLFVTQGDRQRYKEEAQDLGSLLGKVVRLTPDGKVPEGNPFTGRAGVRPEIYSYGHRNVQSAALHPETGRIWTVEHGAKGGDELNSPQPGRNYGWPVITYGVDYDGSKIGEGTAREGMEQPVFYWDPVIAPSGMEFYTGTVYPGWKGSILIGSLTPGAVVRLTLDGGRVTGEERYATDRKERVRDVRQGPDGHVYLVTDEPAGRILRLEKP